MDHLLDRVDALEQQLHTLQQQTRTVTRRLRWWRGLAGGLLMLVVLTWALPLSIAQEDASTGGPRGLAQRVAALETLLTHFSREGNEVFITGANLHLVNGLGQTNCFDEEQGQEIPDCPNGLGNLIVGYNESRVPIAGGEDIRTGSHNVVVGVGNNFSGVGGLIGGRLNTISDSFAVSVGQENTASGFAATVMGGDLNTASGAFSTVSGGSGNTASGNPFGAFSTVSGGSGNTASGGFAVVSGGQSRTAAGEFDWVAGSLLVED